MGLMQEWGWWGQLGVMVVAIAVLVKATESAKLVVCRRTGF